MEDPQPGECDYAVNHTGTHQSDIHFVRFDFSKMYEPLGK